MTTKEEAIAALAEGLKKHREIRAQQEDAKARVKAGLDNVDRALEAMEQDYDAGLLSLGELTAARAMVATAYAEAREFLAEDGA